MEYPPEIKIELTKDEINELPIVSYDGPIYLVENERQLEEAFSMLRGDTVIGLDTEIRPCFNAGQPRNPTALLQLCGEYASVLIRVQKVPVKGIIADFLADPEIIKVGVGIADDMRLLRRSACFVASGLIDIARTAQSAGLKTLGLRSLAANFLGIRINKAARCTNWESPELTPQQIRYAATDAWVGREIYLRMKSIPDMIFEPLSVSEPFVEKKRHRIHSEPSISNNS